MASLKEIKGRINSVRNTQKITSAMRMVATAKLRRTQTRAIQTANYARELYAILRRLQRMLQSQHKLPPTLEQRESMQHVVLIAISSNSGLCGAFNTNLYKAVQERLHFYQERQIAVSVIPIGKKVAQHLQRDGIETESFWIEAGERFSANPSAETQQPLIDLLQRLNDQFLHGLLDKVEIVAPHFKSMGTQTMEVRQIVPFQVELDADLELQEGEDEELCCDYLVEPSPQELYAHMLPLLQRTEFLATLLDAATAEHAARMLAMQTADDNATDLLQELTLIYNKTRQQTITNELIDIMSGKA